MATQKEVIVLEVKTGGRASKIFLGVFKAYYILFGLTRFLSYLSFIYLSSAPWYEPDWQYFLLMVLLNAFYSMFMMLMYVNQIRQPKYDMRWHVGDVLIAAMFMVLYCIVAAYLQYKEAGFESYAIMSEMRPEEIAMYAQLIPQANLTGKGFKGWKIQECPKPWSYLEARFLGYVVAVFYGLEGMVKTFILVHGMYSQHTVIALGIC